MWSTRGHASRPATSLPTGLASAGAITAATDSRPAVEDPQATIMVVGPRVGPEIVGSANRCEVPWSAACGDLFAPNGMSGGPELLRRAVGLRAMVRLGPGADLGGHHGCQAVGQAGSVVPPWCGGQEGLQPDVLFYSLREVCPPC
jgi:hypothetical protein